VPLPLCKYLTGPNRPALLTSEKISRDPVNSIGTT